MHGACVAARYCGGNGVAENGKAAAVVHTTSASLLSLLTVVALRFRSVCGVTQLLPALSHIVLLCFYCTP